VPLRGRAAAEQPAPEAPEASELVG